MSTCRSCDAEVIFVPSATSGRPVILDAQPEKRVVLVRLEGDTVVPTKHVKDARAAVLDTYLDHHATCPNASDWKGKTRASA